LSWIKVSTKMTVFQSFLPQMAHANDELRRKMVTAPAHQFDIENLDSTTEKVIEMVNAYFELSDSDTDEEILTSEDGSESEDDHITGEVTIDNIKFPKQKGEKGKIEILDSKCSISQDHVKCYSLHGGEFRIHSWLRQAGFLKN
uniref:Uncharacterized protein n=1 Tax=Bubo bubo TaxID=30461 RepID=A0A8C0FT78_BUBBB